MTTILNMVSLGLDEVQSNPNFKKHGLSIQVRDNGTIVLRAARMIEHDSKHLSKEDSENVLNLLRIVTEDKEDEESQGNIQA